MQNLFLTCKALQNDYVIACVNFVVIMWWLCGEYVGSLWGDCGVGILKEKQFSFTNIEDNTFQLLQKQPVIALGIFIYLRGFMSYMWGTVLLGGYKLYLNLVQNGAVQYWEDNLQACKIFITLKNSVTSTSENTQPQQLATPLTLNVLEQQALTKTIKLKEGRMNLDPTPFDCLLVSRYVYIILYL